MERLSIIEIPIPTADKDVPIEIPHDCRRFTIKCRTANALRVSHHAGKAAASQAPYFTIPANSAWTETELDLERNQLIYVACAAAGVFVEGMLWTKTGGTQPCPTPVRRR